MPSSSLPASHRLAERFSTPNPTQFGPVPIWWWSGDRITRQRLRWQMEQLLSQGVAQAVIMNLAPSGPLYGALADDPAFMTEEWWELFLAACEDAAELGFRFWPYDQIGFSGANFQGRLVSNKPEWAGQKLGRVTADIRPGDPAIAAAPHNAHPIAAYVVSDDGQSAVSVEVHGATATWEGPGRRLVLVYAQEHGFDYFNSAATAALLDTVHGEFARRASQWFGKVIVGFFQDELPSMPTWGSDFAGSFLDTFGYPIADRIGALWGDPTPEPNSLSNDEVRLNYEVHRARRSRAGFFDLLDAWFATNDLQCGFDQQSPAREGDPVGSVGTYADYLSTHRGFSAPGSDHLGDPKIHSSLSHLSGGSRTWIEAFHSSGWGGTLEETYDWLAPFLKRGATLYDPHAVYYSTSGGWWEWAPPSTCWRQPYWSEYGILSGAVARLSEVLSQGSLACDTALIFPTATVQSGFTFALPTAAAAAASRVYHELNGETAWTSERPGVLDRAGHEYEIVDDSLLGHSLVVDGHLQIGDARFRNVILPAANVIDDGAAAVLAELAAAGGTVIVVESAPDWFVSARDGAREFSRLMSDRTIVTASSSEDVPALLQRSGVWAEAGVPSLLREVEGCYVLALFAHDSFSGTEQPILKGSEGYLDWIEDSWSTFWEGLREGGYNFRPIGDRTTSVSLHGTTGLTAQRWSPVTGERTAVPITVGADGDVSAEVDFRDGSVALLVFAPTLPEGHTAPAQASASLAEVELTDWHIESSSFLDNRWGDFGSKERTGILPLEVWDLEVATGDTFADLEWMPGVATFGPYGEIAGPTGVSSSTSPEWKAANWSLSRGIHKDAVHQDTLGPKGYVPEEFLAWPQVSEGERVGFRTGITVPAENLTLVIGANARASVTIDGAEQVVTGDGYWQSTSAPAGNHLLEIYLTAERQEAIRGSFALVASPEEYRRPEWLAPADSSVAATVVTVSKTIIINEVPADARIQVGAEQPCTVSINGVEVGRQNAFHPYGSHREARFHPYDLAPHLTPGENLLELRSTDSARDVAVIVDSVPLPLGGLGVLTGQGEWQGSREGSGVALVERSQQWLDPRALALVARPHPLPRASWLEKPPFEPGVVVDLIPDVDPSDGRARWARCLLPAGTLTVSVPTELDFVASVEGPDFRQHDGIITFDTPAPVGAVLTLRFTPTLGHRAGAVLNGPLRVTTGRVAATLEDWSVLGFGALAGEVRYLTTVTVPNIGGGERVILDLGSVRGSVQVLINETPVGSLAWGPYEIDITGAVSSGSAEFNVEVRVHNTLAGYLNGASPTPGIFAGQTRAGLLGPVALRVVR